VTSSTVDPIRIAIAGVGAISQLVHLPILIERSDVEVVAITDADAMKARTIGRRFGVAQILSEEEVLANDQIDGVVVCTPNFLHEDLAVRALNAGKHVLVERPVALTADGVRRIHDAAEASGKLVLAGMAHRYRADVAALRALISSGELGDITSVRGAWLNRRVPTLRRTWRQRSEEAGGGALMDLGVQALDTSLWLLGYPEVARVSASIYGDVGGVESEAHLMAVTKAGATITLAVTWSLLAAEDVHQVRVLGVDGQATLSPFSVHRQVGGRALDVTPRQPLPRGGEDLYTNSYRRLLDHFVRLAVGRAGVPPAEEQIRLMRLISAAYQSAQEGREITLE